jgi:HPt (histidine-containing phosphotransfer) domain-containing protein
MTDQKAIMTGPLAQAFMLFVSELESHLRQMRSILEPLRHVDENLFFESCAREAKLFEHTFHTIKGGSGFLGLCEIAQAAHSGELMFKHGHIACSPGTLRSELEKVLGVLETNLHSLQQHGNKIGDGYVGV